MLRLVGDTLIEKFGVATVTVTVAVCTSAPLVAVTVTVYVPGAAAERPSEAVAVDDRLTDAGTVAVSPLAGLTEAAKFTVPANAFSPAKEIVLEPLAPAAMLTAVGAALTEKSGVGGGGATARNAALVFGVPRPVGPS
jgi:hypothetical protein